MAQNEIEGRLTTGELQVASWWVRNRLQVRRVGYAGLGVFCALLWGYVGWSLLDAYAFSYPRESRIPREIALNQQRLTALELDQPQELSLSEVSVLQTTGSRSDLLVEISNPNPMWWAEFSYRFDVSGELTPARAGYVLPNATQIVTELGVKPRSGVGASASLVIENFRWHRLDPAMVGSSYEAFARKRSAFVIREVAHASTLALDSQPLGETSFVLANESAYGFWSVDLILRLFRGPSLIAVNRLSVTQVKPGEQRPLKVVWPESLPGITKAEVIPQVNFLDSQIYLPTTAFSSTLGS